MKTGYFTIRPSRWKLTTRLEHRTTLGFWTNCHLLPGIVTGNILPAMKFYHVQLCWLQFVFNLWLSHTA